LSINEYVGLSGKDPIRVDVAIALGVEKVLEARRGGGNYLGEFPLVASFNIASVKI
jgi:hypothetical protein